MRDFKTWYRSLTPEEKQAFAERAGTSRKYIEVQLVFKRRMPKPDLMRRLADASLGRLQYDDILKFFYAEAA